MITRPREFFSGEALYQPGELIHEEKKLEQNSAQELLVSINNEINKIIEKLDDHADELRDWCDNVDSSKNTVDSYYEELIDFVADLMKSRKHFISANTLSESTELLACLQLVERVTKNPYHLNNAEALLTMANAVETNSADFPHLINPSHFYKIGLKRLGQAVGVVVTMGVGVYLCVLQNQENDKWTTLGAMCSFGFSLVLTSDLLSKRCNPHSEDFTNIPPLRNLSIFAKTAVDFAKNHNQPANENSALLSAPVNH